MPPPATIPFRQFAREHVAAAKVLLHGTDGQLRYACLELRLAIEALAYETLQSYAEDVSDAVEAAHRDWQPSKVLQALRSYDPIADMPLQIVVREIGPDGGPKPGPPMFSGTDDRFKAEWAEKAHRSMGSFLHQRTISQIKRGKALDEGTLRREANRIIERLDSILASEVHNTRLGLRFGYPCPDCGGDISVAVVALLMGKAKTTCGNCQADWDVSQGEDSGSPRFIRRREG